MSIVEKMARVRRGLTEFQWMRTPEALRESYCSAERSTLAICGLTEAQLEGLANGTHYIIERPRFDEGPRHVSDDFRFGEPSNDEVRRAMLATKEG